MNYQKLKDLKEKLNSKKYKRIQGIIKAIVDCVDLGLSIYNIVRVHQSFTKCERYNTYLYEGDDDNQCINTKSNQCVYYAEYPMSDQLFNSEDCWISHQMEHLNIESSSQNYYFGWTIADMITVTLIKIAQFFYISNKSKRVRLIYLFFQITLNFTCTFFIFQSSSVDCNGPCAVMSDVDKANLDIGTEIAYVPFILTACLLLFYFYARCCLKIKHPKELTKSQLRFITLLMCIAIILYIVSNGILLSTFHSFIGISITLKLQLAFLFVYGIYGIYSIYKTKSKKQNNSQEQQPNQDSENNIQSENQTKNDNNNINKSDISSIVQQK